VHETINCKSSKKSAANIYTGALETTTAVNFKKYNIQNSARKEVEVEKGPPEAISYTQTSPGTGGAL
jgi:hypothetical protein